MTSSCACSPSARVTGRVASTADSEPDFAGCESSVRSPVITAAAQRHPDRHARARPGVARRVDVLHGHVAGDPLVTHRHDVNRHAQLAIRRRRSLPATRRPVERPSEKTNTPNGKVSLEPRRELLEGPAPAAFRRPADAGPRPARRLHGARGRNHTSGSRAAVRPAARASARRIICSTACDRLIGASRLMLRDSSIRKDRRRLRAGVLHVLDADRVEQDQDEHAQGRRPQRQRSLLWPGDRSRAKPERQDQQAGEADGQHKIEPAVMRM